MILLLLLSISIVFVAALCGLASALFDSGILQGISMVLLALAVFTFFGAVGVGIVHLWGLALGGVL